MIWDRFVGSQMKPALFDVTDADIRNGNLHAPCLGRSAEVPRLSGGVPGRSERGRRRGEADESKALPAMNEGDVVELLELDTRQNFTQPPPRYTEATLVKALEENGIGRPVDVRPDPHHHPDPRLHLQA